MTGQDKPAPLLALALAMDVNRLIGRNNDMPWHIPGEQAHFKAITLGKPIIMGRKTFESIGRALPGRLNIVVTRDPTWSAEGVTQAVGLDAAISIARERAIADDVDEMIVIGGAALCREAMPVAQRFYLTRVSQAYEGDTWLDTFEESEWREIERSSPDPETTGGIPVHYCVLERRASEPTP